MTETNDESEGLPARVQGAGIAEITLTADKAGCIMSIRESYTGEGLTCFRTYFPGFREAALALAEGLASSEAAHAEILDRIAAGARASAIPARGLST